VERSPGQLLLAVQDLIEIRNLLHGAGVNAPGVLSAVLERAGQALRLFKLGDGGLAAFNGTRDEPAALVELVLTQGQAKSRAPLMLEESGFHRLQAGRAVVVCDAGAPPPGPAGRPGHGAAARGRPLRPRRHAVLRDVGRARAAGRQLRRRARRGVGLARRAARHRRALHPGGGRDQQRGAARRRPGPPPRAGDGRAARGRGRAVAGGRARRLAPALRRRPPPPPVPSQNGEDLRGEDILEMQGPETPLPSFLLRFHLHPEVAANPQEDGESVLLRLPSGQGWRLRSKGARATLEESVHLAGEARRSPRWCCGRRPARTPCSGRSPAFSRPRKRMPERPPLKIAEVTSVDYSLRNFLLPLMRGARDRGHEVVGVCADGPLLDVPAAEGFRIVPVPMARSLDPRAQGAPSARCWTCSAPSASTWSTRTTRSAACSARAARAGRGCRASPTPATASCSTSPARRGGAASRSGWS
jgi:hypothetical protein